MFPLVNFMLILVFFLVRLFQLNQNDNLTDNAVFALWGIVIFMAVIVTVVAIILANVAPLVVRAVQTGEKPNPIDHLEDERDKTIQLRGTQVTQTVLSLGSFVAMLTYAFGAAPPDDVHVVDLLRCIVAGGRGHLPVVSLSAGVLDMANTPIRNNIRELRFHYDEMDPETTGRKRSGSHGRRLSRWNGRNIPRP